MVDKVKDMIINLIGFSNYRRLLTTAMRTVTKVDTKIMYGDCITGVDEYSVPGKDTFFGYYDLKSLSSDGKKLLSMVIDGDKAVVGYFLVGIKEYIKLAETSAWNWQMGARLRWFQDGQSVLFNDFDGNRFISRIVDIQGNEVERFDFPIFDIDLESGIGYYTDFTILHYLREGYGYSNKKVVFEEYYNTTENGVFRFCLNDRTSQLVMSVNDLRKNAPTDDMDSKFHYINHITINPQNGDVMFFHLWTDGQGSWKNRMVFLDRNSNLINIISDFDRASHYDWRDGDHLLASIYVGKKASYRLYNYRTREYDLLDGMQTDGHPTYINNRFFITDTYPNRCAMQSVYMCDSKEHTYRNLFSIYHSPQKNGPERCDLHPRVHGDVINIDSVVGSHRSQYLFSQNCNLRGSMHWDRRLLLDRQAVIENDGPKKQGLFSCMDSEYLFATGRGESNKLKVLHMFVTSPVFRVNVYIAYMQMSDNLKKRRRIRTKLEGKYGLVVDQNCKIGKHFRTDHAVGIVIGPGAIIGDYCKIYQNVTVGQKGGRFPVIGNHVVIFPGAKIIGDVKIGDYAVIGANAVVTKDVPEGATAVGVPARNILRE